MNQSVQDRGEGFFPVRKESIVMMGTTDDSLGRIPFIVYRSGKSDALFICAKFIVKETTYYCSYDNITRLCSSPSELHQMRVEDLEKTVHESSRRSYRTIETIQ